MRKKSPDLHLWFSIQVGIVFFSDEGKTQIHLKAAPSKQTRNSDDLIFFREV